MIVRVGIPHRGGKLAFHAFNHDYPVMVSANAFWNSEAQTFVVPEATNLYELDCALDSAGFTAMKLWQAKGKQPGIAGIFPWTYAQYIELAALVGASWWSQPDLCCEPEIAGSQSEIDFRVNATATLLEGTLQIVHSWQRECSWLTPPVPVIQGWSVTDYLRSLDLLMQVWERWSDAPPQLIGVGSVCRRSLGHPTHGLFAILNSIEGHLPPGSRVHLFGVKGTALSSLKMFDCVASTDSMAYDMRARIRARESKVSNSMTHRSEEMSRWMVSAHDRLQPASGDQLRMNFRM